MLVRPRRLQEGDRLAAVSLSWGGPGTFPHRYEAGKRQLEAALGVEVVEMPHTLADAASLAADPAARAGDLHRAFADPDIAGVVSTIGGDDSIRLLRHLDLDLLAANPKVFLGYSDSTIIQMALLRAGLTSFYGPAIMAGFAENAGLHDYLVRGFDAPCSTRRHHSSGRRTATGGLSSTSIGRTPPPNCVDANCSPPPVGAGAAVPPVRAPRWSAVSRCWTSCAARPGGHRSMKRCCCSKPAKTSRRRHR